MASPCRGPLLAMTRLSRASGFALVDEAVFLDPGHHVTQLRADRLDLLLGAHATHCLEHRRARAVFENELASKLAALDFLEDALHLGLGLVGNDARPARKVAVLGGVRDRVAHVRDAP